jgi:hypothetical protein
MAVTRSRSIERNAGSPPSRGRAGWRFRELIWLLAAALFVAGHLYLVYQAKSRPLAEIEQGLAAKKLLNLNDLGAREDLLPALSAIPDSRQRQETARQIYFLSGGLSHVGAIRGALTADQFRYLKPLLVVRRPAAFRRSFFRWIALFFAAFLLVQPARVPR